MKGSPEPAIFLSYPLVRSLYESPDGIRGRTGRKFKASSLSTLNNLLRLSALLEAHGPRETLEIGMALGGSSTLFASWHHERDHGPKSHLAIDPFQHSVWDYACLEYLKSHDMDGYVELLNEFSCHALPRLIQDGRRFGLIYVDGSHLFEDVFVDFYYSVRLLEPGGVIAFDDSTDDHVAKVHNFIRTNMRGKLRRVNVAVEAPGTRPGSTFKERLKGCLGLSQMIAYTLESEFTPRDWNAPFHDF